MTILKSLIGIGVETRNLPKDSLDAKRLLEEPSLEFVTMSWFLQILLGRKYILENLSKKERTSRVATIWNISKLSAQVVTLI